MHAHPIDCPRCRILLADLEETLSAGASTMQLAQATRERSEDLRVDRAEHQNGASAAPAPRAASGDVQP